MYARTVQGRPLTFVVSGLLWEYNLVMVDLETGTLWSQLLGKAMQGPLEGEALEIVPSRITNWQSWRDRYPQTTAGIASRTLAAYTSEHERLNVNLVVGLTLRGKTRTWPFYELRKMPVVNDQLDEQPVLVYFDQDSMTATVFSRRVDQRTVSFELRSEGLFDRETGSQWDWLTGQAVGGEMAGKRLEALPAIVSEILPWSYYRPNQTSWSASE